MYVHLQLPAKPLAQYKAQHDSLLIHSSFIHSFRLFLYTAPLQVHYYSEALPTQHGYCVEGCATGNKGLAQGLYEAVRAGFELATLRTKDVDSINEPAHPN